MLPPATVAGLTALLAAVPSVHAMYTKNSPVLQLSKTTYRTQIEESNYTSIVEFYAPWCGHCKNLKPIYEVAAKKLDGLAKVAAVDCDDEMNKQFCGAMGVQGFPTLKIVRPGKKPGRPVVEDYQGPRTAKAIVEAVKSKINNHVTRVADKDLDAFLKPDGPKAILFTEKGTTSALLRSLAIDFLDVVSVAQVRNKEEKTVEKFAIKKFPTFVLVPGGDKEPIVYDGEFNKKDMVAFLKQVGEPNPDPAPVKPKVKGDKKKAPKSSEDAEGKKTKGSSSTKPETEESATTPEASTETTATEPAASTVDAIPITMVTTKDTLVEKCLRPDSHTCVVALIPADASENGAKVTDSLTQLNTKYVHGQRQLFPFLAIRSNVEGLDLVRQALGLEKDVELIAVNARRSWWRHYEGNFGAESVEEWIDAIRMGEGAKNKLPRELIAAEEVVEEGSDKKTDAGEEQAAEEVKHEEL